MVCSLPTRAVIVLYQPTHQDIGVWWFVKYKRSIVKAPIRLQYVRSGIWCPSPGVDPGFQVRGGCT